MVEARRRVKRVHYLQSLPPPPPNLPFSVVLLTPEVDDGGGEEEGEKGEHYGDHLPAAQEPAHAPLLLLPV
jgi:hypothetical protein